MVKKKVNITVAISVLIIMPLLGFLVINDKQNLQPALIASFLLFASLAMVIYWKKIIKAIGG